MRKWPGGVWPWFVAGALLIAACNDEKPEAAAPPPPAKPVTQTTPDDPMKSRVYNLKDLKTVTIPLAGKPHRLWIMDDEGKRAEGMMFLTEAQVKEDEGMLFVFKDPQPPANGFWMHNCPLGLDIVYVTPQKKVLSVGDGVPYREESVMPGGCLPLRRRAPARAG